MSVRSGLGSTSGHRCGLERRPAPASSTRSESIPRRARRSSPSASRTKNAPYIERGVDGELRAALAEAAARRDVSLIVLSGPSKAGKSRTLLEAAAAALPDAWLLAPKGPATLAEMTSRRAVGENPTPLLIWLDDLEPWVKQREGGSQHGHPRGIPAAGRGRRWSSRPRAGRGSTRPARMRRVQRDRGQPPRSRSELPQPRPPLTSAEAASLSARFGPEATEQVEDIGGIAELMIAAPRLIERLMAKSDCPPGSGRRVGRDRHAARRLLRPARASELEALYPTYLAGTPSSPADEFAVGLRWATRPLYASTALLSQADGADEYFPHDYVVEHAWRDTARSTPRCGTG